MLDLHKNPLFWEEEDIRKYKFKGISSHLKKTKSGNHKKNFSLKQIINLRKIQTGWIYNLW